MTCAVADVEGDWHLPQEVLRTMGDHRHVQSHSESLSMPIASALPMSWVADSCDERDDRSMQNCAQLTARLAVAMPRDLRIAPERGDLLQELLV